MNISKSILNAVNTILESTEPVNLEEAKDPCWKGYKQVGMKKKAGKEVPNCVPEEKVEEEVNDKKITKDMLRGRVKVKNRDDGERSSDFKPTKIELNQEEISDFKLKLFEVAFAKKSPNIDENEKEVEKECSEHPDEEEDKKLVKKMVKKTALKTEENINEASEYEVRHKTHSDALRHAEEHLKKRGYEIHPDNYHAHIDQKEYRPYVGHTHRYTVPLHKNGEPTKKHAHIQIYKDENSKKPYELNMYHD